MEPPSPLLHAPVDRAAIEPDDAALVARSAADPRAFDTIYRRHVRAIHLYVAARVGPHHAEDVVAEVFATAFERRSAFDRSATSARPWLYGIAAKKLHHHRAAEVRWLHQPQAAIDVDRDVNERARERVDAFAVVPELAEALAALTPAERDVLVLYVFEEMTHREIAQALGIRRGTAKVRLHRGRERLRAAIDRGDER